MKKCIDCQLKEGTNKLTVKIKDTLFNSKYDTIDYLCENCVDNFQGMDFWQTHPMYPNLQVKYLINN